MEDLRVNSYVILLYPIVYILIYLLVFIVVFLSYILESFALYKILSNMNFVKPKLSLIPFYNKFLLGGLVSMNSLGIILGIFQFLSMILGIIYLSFDFNKFILYIFLLCLIVSLVLNIFISNKVFKILSHNNLIFAILNTISLGFLTPVLLFSLKNKKIR